MGLSELIDAVGKLRINELQKNTSFQEANTTKGSATTPRDFQASVANGHTSVQSTPNSFSVDNDSILNTSSIKSSVEVARLNETIARLQLQLKEFLVIFILRRLSRP
jgi:hypothetical protein